MPQWIAERMRGKHGENGNQCSAHDVDRGKRSPFRHPRVPRPVGRRVANTPTPAHNGVDDILGALLRDLAKGLQKLVELRVEGGTEEIGQYWIAILNSNHASTVNLPRQEICATP